MDSHNEEQWPEVMGGKGNDKETKVSILEKLLTAELALAFIAHDVRCFSLDIATDTARTALKQINE